MNGDARFGAWLKRQRHALDLSREDLAHQISCSVSLVEKIETGERRPSRQIAVLLAGRFGVPADQQPEFINFARSVPDSLAALPTDQAPGAALQHPCPHLPMPTTALIGRTRELAELAALVARSDCRLITLVGPGGIGKTQLALQAARQAQHVGHGACFVALALVAAPELLVTAIARALGFTFHDQAEPTTQRSTTCASSGCCWYLIIWNTSWPAQPGAIAAIAAVRHDQRPMIIVGHDIAPVGVVERRYDHFTCNETLPSNAANGDHRKCRGDPRDRPRCNALQALISAGAILVIAPTPRSSMPFHCHATNYGHTKSGPHHSGTARKSGSEAYISSAITLANASREGRSLVSGSSASGVSVICIRSGSVARLSLI